MAGRTAVGLDIGTSAVRAAELSLGRGVTKLERFAQVALPAGAVRDGEVIDQASVTAAIKRLWSEGKFSTKRVALGVSNQKVIVRQVDLPWMEQAELRKALALQVQDFIPIPAEQAVLDFHPIEELVSESGARILRVLLVAAARDMLSAAMDAVEGAGLHPMGIDLTPFAVVRALADGDSLGLDAQAEALVEIGARVTNIVVHQGGVPRFVRILMMGGADLTEAVAERIGVDIEAAEATKQQLGIPGSPADRDNHPASRTIEAAASAFVEEVRGSLDYYMAASAAPPIRRLIVSGGGSRLNNLVNRLSMVTRLPAVQANPLARLSLGKTGLTTDQLSQIEPLAAVPIGLALGVAS